MKKKRSGYSSKLDYLRLFACAAVFLYHLNILKGGYLTVNTFFVLSAYLTVSTFSLEKYYQKRFVRIYLPLLLVTLSANAAISLFKDISWVNQKPETLSVLLGYNNYWQINADLDYFTRHLSSPFMHMWYIAIILQFDLLFPLVYIALRMAAKQLSRIAPYLICLVIVISSFSVFVFRIKNGAVMKAYYGTFARCFSLFMGIGLGFHHRRYRPLALGNRDVREIVFYVYLLLLFLMCIFIPADSGLMSLSMFISSIISLRLISYAVADKDKEKADPLVRLLAKMSYTIYLLQYPLIFLFDKTSLPSFIKVPLIISCTLILSWLFTEALNFRKSSRAYRPLLAAMILLVSIYGGYRFIIAEDYSEQMQELQEHLNENQQLIEQKNQEFLEKQQQENGEYSALIDSSLSAEEAVKQLLTRMPVTGVGDSIMIDVADKLYELFPNGYFDGKISRDLYAGNEILEGLKQDGSLSDTLILCLAVNGDYIEKRNENLMRIVEERQVFWVNAVGADDPQFNERFEEFAKNYPNLHIVDWVSASKGHPEYFYYDNIHVMGEGVDALAKTIYDAVYDFYLQQYKENRQNDIDQAQNEIRKRISFYGNDALINSYRFLNQSLNKAIYNTDSNYDYESVTLQLQKDIAGGSLENRVVFLFDQQASLSGKDYQKLAELCTGHEVYIVDLNGKLKDLKIDNGQIIDFSSRMKAGYLLGDQIHLSDEGNKALSALISSKLQ